MNMPENALSVRQPWASAIILRGKDVENRGWKCPSRWIGQRVLIHAGKALTADEIESFKATVDTIPGGWATDGGNMIVRNLPLGGIIGSVEIVGCVEKSDSPWFCGPFGFVLARPEPLPFRPCRGMLGFFTPTYL